MLIFLISLPSCQKNSFTSSHDLNSEFPGGLKDDPFQVVLSETPIILNSIDKKTTNGSLESRSPEIIIKSTDQMNDDHGKAAIYMVNYTADGKERFAFLSGDKREIPVLAFGENFQNFYDMPSGPADWTQSRLNKIKDIRKENKPEQELDVKKAWANLDLLPLGVVPPPPPPGCGTWTSVTMGPLTTTKWGQGCSNGTTEYNYFIQSCNANCGHKLLGCVAVAVGQLMKFHNFGQASNTPSFSWSTMSTNNGSTVIGGNSHLLYYVAQYLNTIFGCSSSSSDDQAAVNTLHSFGYSGAVKCNFNSSLIVNERNAGRPVYIGGFNNGNPFNGHAWVIDGYYKYGDDCTQYMFYNCNWGWNSLYNGLYSAPFTPGDKYYIPTNIIIGIHP